ncbi:MAG: geranylgeranylglycerol-phosphate geranylgeranyltransferase [Thermaurantimonas sp.]|uniref:geranylgeranylglycerol-phosphate geranylgeranyltransferase n=1 Tax=Thermaurantimonas sp. TaxID=2681568 RepID=UPI003918CA5A
MVATFFDYLKLVRWKNLLLAAFIQLFLRYGFYIPFGIDPALDHWQFAAGVLATMLLMAAGYIINDIYDVDTDKINKPDRLIIQNKVSEKNAWILYYLFNAIGLIISFSLSLIINRFKYFSIPVITVVLLFLYATDFKRKPLIGNLIISLLAALSIITVLFFDIMPLISMPTTSVELRYFVLIVHVFIAVFAFLTTLVRELIKTLEDMAGDWRAGYATLPLKIGEKKTIILSIFTLISLFAFSLFSVVKVNAFYLYVYSGIFLLMPWTIVFYLLISDKDNKYKMAQRWMKISMFTGILSLLVLQI